jgi:hypothetical protein
MQLQRMDCTRYQPVQEPDRRSQEASLVRYSSATRYGGFTGESESAKAELVGERLMGFHPRDRLLHSPCSQKQGRLSKPLPLDIGGSRVKVLTKHLTGRRVKLMSSVHTLTQLCIFSNASKGTSYGCLLRSNVSSYKHVNMLCRAAAFRRECSRQSNLSLCSISA